jgi:hypothetical protein
MSWRRIVVPVTSMLLSVSAFAADWRVYSDDINKEEAMLYSASDVARDGDHVRAWIEVISMKDVASFLADKKHPETVEKAVGRMKAGYKPPFAEHNDFDAQLTASVALMEEVANEQAAPVRSRALLEFDCAAGRSRILQYSSFPPGPERHSTEPLPWVDIAPDANEAILKSWVCKRD